MLIYPDTANLNAIRDGKINPSLIKSLTTSRPDIRWVITVTHFDDAVGADGPTFFELQRVAQGLPNAMWILPGMCIPHAETTRFVESFLRIGRAPDSGIQVTFPTSDLMFAAYPDFQLQRMLGVDIKPPMKKTVSTLTRNLRRNDGKEIGDFGLYG